LNENLIFNFIFYDPFGRNPILFGVKFTLKKKEKKKEKRKKFIYIIDLYLVVAKGNLSK
jgi:hypothetical protein